MAISRMQEPQQIQRGLGSLQDPRQNYGLGKLVKKAFRGIKKIAKSPLGKAALLGLGAYGLGGAKFLGGSGMFTGGQGMARFGNLMNLIRPAATNATGKRGLLSGLFYGPKGKFSLGRTAMTGLTGAALAAPFFMGKDDEEEEEEESWTNVPSSIADIRNQAKNYYTLGSAGSNLNFMPQKQFVDANYYAADGGRVGLLAGGKAGNEQIVQLLMAEYIKYKNQGGQLTFEQFVQAVMQQQEGGMEQPQELPQEGEVIYAADGGRIGYNRGRVVNPGGYAGEEEGNIQLLWEAIKKQFDPKHWVDMFNFFSGKSGEINSSGFPPNLEIGEGFGSEALLPEDLKAHGGRIGLLSGGLLDDDEDETTYNPYAATKMYRRMGKQEGGIMESEAAEEMINMNGQEKDYRETGGFVNLGGKERADDVPARLSKNEFVFTADAVRAAGGGDIDAGSEVMQNMMDNLEQGGEISEESQGLEGAQAMYDQQQMLQSRIA